MSTPTFSCAAAGATACGWKAKGTTEEQILAEVAEHLRTVHDVKVVSNTLVKYALAVAHGEVSG